MGLRVCLVTPFAWSRPHDVNEHVAGVARELRALGHAVTVLAPSTRAADLIEGRRALLETRHAREDFARLFRGHMVAAQRTVDHEIAEASQALWLRHQAGEVGFDEYFRRKAQLEAQRAQPPPPERRNGSGPRDFGSIMKSLAIPSQNPPT